MSHDEGPEAAYNNTHRAFLQALLARQTITYEEAKPILAAIQTAATPARPTLPADVTQDDFDTYVWTLNAQLSPFDLEIRSSLHQTSRQRVYALVNMTSDALTQMATAHSPDEIAFVKRLLDAMFDTNNTPRAEVMAVRAMQAVRLAKSADESNRRELNRTESRGDSEAPVAVATSTNLTLTGTQAEKTLASLVAEGWFELSAGNFYSLGPRALMELRVWLVETYNDQLSAGDENEDEELYQKIKFCQACKDIVTVGQRCPKMSCSARLHNHCVRNMFRAQGGQERCPICKTSWGDPLPVGERAARGGAVRSSAAGRYGGGARMNSTINEEEDDEDLGD